ncbi:MAG: YybH family protein [Solirubrobacterales bacterium]
MDSATGQRAIEVPVDSLPPVDEHGVEIAADADQVWEALAATLPKSLNTRRSAGLAKVLNCAFTEASGEPTVIGSTVPGFIVSRSIRPSVLALLGQHRFSRYALVFRIDELGTGRSRLRAETRAEFPRAKGRVYRALVIGTGGHILVVRRILSAVRRRAEGKRATVDRAQIRQWVTDYERAWRTDGTGSLSELFSEDATYSTSPFEEPHHGLGAIASMWERERLGPDESFAMNSEVVAVEADTGVVRVEVRYGPPKEKLYRDLWIVRLDADGRCIHFEEWPFWPPGTEGAPTRGGDA